MDRHHEHWNWTTRNNIERDINRNVPSRLLKSINLTEGDCVFEVTVKLVRWSWLALGFIHRHYQKKLQLRCDIGKPVAVVGTVKVR